MGKLRIYILRLKLWWRLFRHNSRHVIAQWLHKIAYRIDSEQPTQTIDSGRYRWRGSRETWR